MTRTGQYGEEFDTQEELLQILERPIYRENIEKAMSFARWYRLYGSTDMRVDWNRKDNNL